MSWLTCSLPGMIHIKPTKLLFDGFVSIRRLHPRLKLKIFVFCAMVELFAIIGEAWLHNLYFCGLMCVFFMLIGKRIIFVIRNDPGEEGHSDDYDGYDPDPTPYGDAADRWLRSKDYVTA